MFKLAILAILAVVLFNAYQASTAPTSVERAADSVQTTWDKASTVGLKIIQTVDNAADKNLPNKKTN